MEIVFALVKFFSRNAIGLGSLCFFLSRWGGLVTGLNGVGVFGANSLCRAFRLVCILCSMGLVDSSNIFLPVVCYRFS